jgi:hypothetical protein
MYCQQYSTHLQLPELVLVLLLHLLDAPHHLKLLRL